MKDNLSTPSTFQDLVKDVAQPTTEAQPQATFTPLPNEPVEPQPHTAPAVTDAPPKHEPLDAELVDISTDVALGFIDAGQAKIFELALKAKRKKRCIRVYGEDALAAIEMYNSEDTTEPQTDTERGVFATMKKFDAAIQELPFSEDELEKLKPLLKKWIEKHNGQIPESFFHWMAITQIVGGRLLTVLTL